MTSRLPLANILLAVFTLLLFGLSFEKGREYGMASGGVDPSWRYRIFGIPIVISELYYGRPYDYSGYKKVEGVLEPYTASLEHDLPTLTSLQHVESAGPFYILNDDKGVVDFTRLALAMFGLRTASLYYTYFTLLAVSSVLFLVSYLHDREKLALLALFALAVYVTMPAFVARTPGISVLDLHTFGILSFAAALHVLLAAADPKRLRPLQIATTSIQAVFLVFVCHARLSNLTQVLAVACLYPLLLWWSRSDARERTFTASSFAPLAILLAAIALLPVYQRWAYHPEYFSGRMLERHPLYHNLLIGLQWNPHLRERHELGYSDLGAADAVDAFLSEDPSSGHSIQERWAALGLITVTTQQPFDWKAYETAARGLYLRIAKQDPRETLMTYLYYHPRDVAQIFVSYVRHRPSPQIDLDEHLDNNVFDIKDVYRPFGPIAIIGALIIAVLAQSVSPLDGLRLPFVALVLLAWSLAVPLAFYAGGFVVLAETFVMAAFTMYATVVVAVLWVARRVPAFRPAVIA